MIGISIEGATVEEIDAIWVRAMLALNTGRGLLATLAALEPLSDEDALPDVDEPSLREMLRQGRGDAPH